MLARTVATALGSLTLAAPALAGPLDWSAPATIGPGGGGVAVAVDRANRTLVVWRNATGDIAFVRLGAAGDELARGSLGASPGPVTIKVELNTDGDALATWIPRRPPGGGIARLEVDGSVGALTVAGTTPGDGLRGAIGPDAMALLAWPRTGGKLGPRIEWAIRAGRTPMATPRGVIGSPGGATAPSLALDGRGNAIAAWATAHRTVWAYRRAGRSFPARSQQLGTAAGTPVVRFTPRGEALAAWIGLPAGSPDARLFWSTRPAGGAFPLDGTAVAERADWRPTGVPSLAMSDDGGAILAWTGVSDLFSGPSSFGVGGSTIFWLPRRPGRPIPSQVGNTGFGSSGSNGPFAIAFDAANEAVAVWIDAPGPRHLYSAVRPPDSSFFVKDGALSSAPLSAPAVAFGPTGRAVAVWSEESPGGAVVRRSELQLTSVPRPGYDPNTLIPLLPRPPDWSRSVRRDRREGPHRSWSPARARRRDSVGHTHRRPAPRQGREVARPDRHLALTRPDPAGRGPAAAHTAQGATSRRRLPRRAEHRRPRRPGCRPHHPGEAHRDAPSHPLRSVRRVQAGSAKRRAPSAMMRAGHPDHDRPGRHHGPLADHGPGPDDAVVADVAAHQDHGVRPDVAVRADARGCRSGSGWRRSLMTRWTVECV